MCFFVVRCDAIGRGNLLSFVSFPKFVSQEEMPRSIFLSQWLFLSIGFVGVMLGEGSGPPKISQRLIPFPSSFSLTQPHAFLFSYFSTPMLLSLWFYYLTVLVYTYIYLCVFVFVFVMGKRGKLKIFSVLCFFFRFCFRY